MTTYTINGAFRTFMLSSVRLPSTQVAAARTSRDWLLKQVNGLSANDSAFPLLYPDAHLHFGSFARRTKCRPLDDIDLMVGIAALGGIYQDDGLGTCRIILPDGHRLARCRDAEGFLNSRQVVNQFTQSLAAVPSYRQATLNRRGSAAVLDLDSYPWVFDVVPAFLTTPEWDGRTYFLIPDGKGHWRKTDPRIDRDRATRINQEHGGYVLDVVRLVKLWVKRKWGLQLGSYLTEALVLAYYSTPGVSADQYMDSNLRDVLGGMATLVQSDVQDPKGIDGNINHLSFTDRMKASEAFSAAATQCGEAIALEQSNPTKAVRLWQALLGEEFGA